MKSWQFFLLLPFLFLFVGHSFAQTPQIGGYVPEDSVALSKIPVADLEALKGASLPESHNILTNLLMPLYQGEVCSCVGMAVAHAYAILYADWTKTCHGKAEWLKFSGSYVYNHVKLPGHTCREGARIDSALQLLVDRGICLEKDFPNSPTKCTPKPGSKDFKAASPYKIKGYEQVFLKAEWRQDKDKVIEKIKTAVSANVPVIVGMRLPLSFQDCKTGIWPWSAPPPGEQLICHAMVVTAYDKNHFTVLNSQGEGWGDKGYTKIKIEDIKQHDMLITAFLMHSLPCD